jgi:hypothetical protein
VASIIAIATLAATHATAKTARRDGIVLPGVIVSIVPAPWPEIATPTLIYCLTSNWMRRGHMKVQKNRKCTQRHQAFSA